MQYSFLFGTVCAAILNLFTMSSHAALSSVLNGQAVYDDDLDITWVADANLAASNTFGLPTGESLGQHPDDITGFGLNGIIYENGVMNWSGALFFIDAMNEANYLGFSDWRLAITLVPDSTCTNSDGSPNGTSQGLDCTGSEMGHLFYIEFGADRLTSALTTGTQSELDKFSNIQFGYWSSTEASGPWVFDFSNGGQANAHDLFSVNAWVWAVRDGDVGGTGRKPMTWLPILLEND